MKNIIRPNNYKSSLNLKQTELAIKLVKDTFEEHLSSELKLRRVTSPLFVMKGTGINDDLNGTERKVTFPIKDLKDGQAEVVNSLAKWKRLALADYKINHDFGIYTDMNAIRPDEELDNIHSLYVDQWDWEKVIHKKDRTIDFLKVTVKKIYEVLKRTEFVVFQNFPTITPILPEQITFIHSEELRKLYPDLSPAEREKAIVKKHKAVFVMGIGGKLSDGKIHDGRAPDYDDWSSPNEEGFNGLNGDILVWHPVLEIALELSSMGIRVDPETLSKQLKISDAEDRKELMFHKKLLNGELPLSLGGGIGQSRLCMFFLRKAHIGETQSGIWTDEILDTCKKDNITLM